MTSQFEKIRAQARRSGLFGLLVLTAAGLGGCKDDAPVSAKIPTVVQVETARLTDQQKTVTLTGSIATRVESDLGFRIAGRIAARYVEVGDRVKKGQLLATLETTLQRADVAAAKARLVAAQATVRETQANFRRQSDLLAQGFTTRTRFDAAKQAQDSALADLDRSRADLGRAEDALTHTELRADADGVVTVRSGEVGRVVDVAQTVYTIAKDGPRDAVFDVFETVTADSGTDRRVELSLTTDPSVKARGTIREIAPSVDPLTGTVRIKVALDNPPAEMGLGTPVTGSFQSRSDDAVVLPWTAFFADRTSLAVWVVDAKTHQVSLKPVIARSYRTDELVVSEGLDGGELVVTRGGKFLRPGEVVTPRSVTTTAANLVPEARS